MLGLGIQKKKECHPRARGFGRHREWVSHGDVRHCCGGFLSGSETGMSTRRAGCDTQARLNGLSSPSDGHPRPARPPHIDGSFDLCKLVKNGPTDA